MQVNYRSSIYTTWYILGALFLGLQAMLTVYQLSTTISDGQKIAKLQRDRQQLSEQKTQAEHLSTSLVAISQVEQQLPEGFHAVEKPLIIRTSDSVASR